MRHSPFIVALVAAAAAGCTGGGLNRDRGGSATAVPDRVAASAAVLSGYLELLQTLVQSPPAQQAEMLATTQREYDLAPTPSHQLRYALVLAAPGHAATDLPRAQRLLRELMATPETLLPAERALAFLELQKVDSQLGLATENRRLQISAARDDQEKVAALTKRLQMETDENVRLRKDLEEARAKLDAIANIERSLNERKPPQ